MRPYDSKGRVLTTDPWLTFGTEINAVCSGILLVRAAWLALMFQVGHPSPELRGKTSLKLQKVWGSVKRAKGKFVVDRNQRISNS